MKKWLLPVGIIALIVILIASSYNGLVGLRADAETAWANVENSYQRRNDLIENLVETVKGAAQHEQGTLTAVIEARSKATQVNIDPSNITAEQLAEFQQAQSGISSALSRLLVSVERYPDLKANQNFLELQSQLEGTENRINVTRDRYNETVNVYDKKIKSFPQVLFAGVLGFKEMARFQADEEARTAPRVQF